MVAESVVLSGWKEFIADTKRYPARIQRQVRMPLRKAAQQIVSRAAPLATNLVPGGGRGAGTMGRKVSIRVTGLRVKITWLEPQAGVMEFGQNYQRQSRGGGTHTVHMLPDDATPRFAYRAWEQIEPTFGAQVLDAIAEAAAATGYWRVD